MFSLRSIYVIHIVWCHLVLGLSTMFLMTMWPWQWHVIVTDVWHQVMPCDIPLTPNPKFKIENKNERKMKQESRIKQSPPSSILTVHSVPLTVWIISVMILSLTQVIT